MPCKKISFNFQRKNKKKQEIAKGREVEREQNTPNGQRRAKYRLMACTGELGSRELKHYLEIRAYLFNRIRPSERPDLPYESPKQQHYDLARKLLSDFK